MPRQASPSESASAGPFCRGDKRPLRHARSTSRHPHANRPRVPMQESSDLMRYWHDAPRRRRDVVTIPTIWLAFVLSLVVHLAALWEFLPKLPLLPGEASRAKQDRRAIGSAPCARANTGTVDPFAARARCAGSARRERRSRPRRSRGRQRPRRRLPRQRHRWLPPLRRFPSAPLYRRPLPPPHRPLRRVRRSKAISRRSSRRGAARAANPSPRRPSAAR